MNEVAIFSKAQDACSKLLADEVACNTQVRQALDLLAQLMRAAQDEASTSEAGRRWYRQQNERKVPGFTKRENDLKTRISTFDTSLPCNTQIKALKKLLEDVEIFMRSGLGRYISG